MIEENGILLKFSGPWRAYSGVEEHFFPTNESLSLAELLKKLEGFLVGYPGSQSDGFVCLFDEEEGPRALKQEDIVLPGSKLLFLGTVESG